jgi:hydrogenase maturation protease
MTPRVRVVGMGSPHGDDALAWSAIDRLEQSCRGRPELAFHRVMGGQQLLDLLDGQGTLILIDALSGGGAPGVVQRFSWPDERFQSSTTRSTHDFGAAEALRLAGVLGSLPGEITIFGIEAKCCEPNASLSPRVAAALPVLVQQVRELLESATPAAKSDLLSTGLGG